MEILFFTEVTTRQHSGRLVPPNLGQGRFSPCRMMETWSYITKMEHGAWLHGVQELVETTGRMSNLNCRMMETLCCTMTALLFGLLDLTSRHVQEYLIHFKSEESWKKDVG